MQRNFLQTLILIFFKYQTFYIQAAHVRKWKSIESEEEGYQGL